MGVLAVLLGLAAWGVCLDHLRYGALMKGECLGAREKVSHEAVALGLSGLAVPLAVASLLRR